MLSTGSEFDYDTSVNCQSNAWSIGSSVQERLFAHIKLFSNWAVAPQSHQIKDQSSNVCCRAYNRVL